MNYVTFDELFAHFVTNGCRILRIRSLDCRNDCHTYISK